MSNNPKHKTILKPCVAHLNDGGGLCNGEWVIGAWLFTSVLLRCVFKDLYKRNLYLAATSLLFFFFFTHLSLPSSAEYQWLDLKLTFLPNAKFCPFLVHVGPSHGRWLLASQELINKCHQPHLSYTVVGGRGVTMVHVASQLGAPLVGRPLKMGSASQQPRLLLILKGQIITQQHIRIYRITLPYNRDVPVFILVWLVYFFCYAMATLIKNELIC